MALFTYFSLGGIWGFDRQQGKGVFQTLVPVEGNPVHYCLPWHDKGLLFYSVSKEVYIKFNIFIWFWFTGIVIKYYYMVLSPHISKLNWIQFPCAIRYFILRNCWVILPPRAYEIKIILWYFLSCGCYGNIVITLRIFYWKTWPLCFSH